jgi:DNA-binding MarR family transcriptional regulator
VQLTPEGRKMRDTAQGYASDVLDHALAGLSDKEIDVLRGLLQRVKSNVS